MSSYMNALSGWGSQPVWMTMGFGHTLARSTAVAEALDVTLGPPGEVDPPEVVPPPHADASRINAAIAGLRNETRLCTGVPLPATTRAALPRTARTISP